MFSVPMSKFVGSVHRYMISSLLNPRSWSSSNVGFSAALDIERRWKRYWIPPPPPLPPAVLDFSTVNTAKPRLPSLQLSSLNALDSVSSFHFEGARCSSVVRTFAHGAMGRRIDPSWSGPIDLFLVPASDPRLV